MNGYDEIAREKKLELQKQANDKEKRKKRKHTSHPKISRFQTNKQSARINEIKFMKQSPSPAKTVQQFQGPAGFPALLG